MNASPVRVALVDDDELVREGLLGWFETLSEVEVVGAASEASSCLELLAEHRPDVLLVDVVLPGLSGIELVRKVSETYPDVRCVMVSGSDQPELVFTALVAGASGYLPKITSAEELRLALQHVSQGRWYLSPVITRPVLQRALDQRAGESGSESVDAFPDLSDRERELLKLISEGNTFAQIAEALDINARSVERLKNRLSEKLRANSLADLIRAAIRYGLIKA